MRIAFADTHIARGNKHQPTNWVKDSAPYLPNIREIGPPIAATHLRIKTVNPPIDKHISR